MTSDNHGCCHYDIPLICSESAARLDLWLKIRWSSVTHRLCCPLRTPRLADHVLRIQQF
jgi:hypothetical protein